MKEATTKNQHYVPQFYLRQFTNQSGKLWVYDRKEQKYFTCSPKQICYEPYLYETEWENANSKLGKFVAPNEIENLLAKEEAQYDKCMKRLIDVCANPSNKNSLIMNEKERALMVDFIANLLVRNPWFLNQGEEDSFLTETMKNPGIQSIDQLLQQMTIGGTKSLIEEARKRTWLDSRLNREPLLEIKNSLFALNFSVLVSDGVPFITSNFPVLYNSFEAQDKMTCSQIVYFPLHPRFALYYSEESCTRPYRNKMVPISQNASNHLNGMHLKNSSERARFLISNEKSILMNLMKPTTVTKEFGNDLS